MQKSRQDRLGIVGLAIAIVLLVGMPATTTMAQTQTKKVPQVAIGLETNSATQAQIAEEVRQQLRSRGVAFKEQDVQTASRNAINKLKAPEKDPLKGVIYIKFKKFTICISWGSDRDFCKSH